MKASRSLMYSSVALLLLALPAHAHDSDDHAHETQAWCCAAMKDMDHARMAMHKYCSEVMQSEDEPAGEVHADHAADLGSKEHDKGKPKARRGHRHKR